MAEQPLTVADVRKMLNGAPLDSAQVASGEPVTPPGLNEAQPPITIETVTEHPLETIEIVEIVEAEDAPKVPLRGKTKAR